MGAIHNFYESLEVSHKYADAPWWEKVYRAAFGGDFASMACIRDDGWAQRGGIDRIVLLKSGRHILVDEKVRQKAWPDILLERWSDEERRIAGWIQKPLACEFIAYAMVETEVCYLFPTLSLQRAWRINGKQWIKKYKEVRAYNKGYTTLSVAVPIAELFKCLTEAMTVNWGGKMSSDEIA